MSAWVQVENDVLLKPSQYSRHNAPAASLYGGELGHGTPPTAAHWSEQVLAWLDGVVGTHAPREAEIRASLAGSPRLATLEALTKSNVVAAVSFLHVTSRAGQEAFEFSGPREILDAAVVDGNGFSQAAVPLLTRTAEQSAGIADDWSLSYLDSVDARVRSDFHISLHLANSGAALREWTEVFLPQLDALIAARAAADGRTASDEVALFNKGQPVGQNVSHQVFSVGHASADPELPTQFGLDLNLP